MELKVGDRVEDKRGEGTVMLFRRELGCTVLIDWDQGGWMWYDVRNLDATLVKED